MLQPGVQNVKDLTTKEIQKADSKLKKDNASLIFNGDSLKQAKVLKWSQIYLRKGNYVYKVIACILQVLGQVDEKFIAAQIKGRCYQSLEISEYLVLFDQHAVHERIRLENNLAGLRLSLFVNRSKISDSFKTNILEYRLPNRRQMEEYNVRWIYIEAI